MTYTQSIYIPLSYHNYKCRTVVQLVSTHRVYMPQIYSLDSVIPDYRSFIIPLMGHGMSITM